MKKILYFIFLLIGNLFANKIIVNDVLDRKITLLKPTNKIIALGTSLSYVTYLNAIDKVIGIELIELKDINKRTYTYVNFEKIKKLPIVGEGGKSKRPNLEAIISLQPDVIFMITNDRNEADLLSKQLNIPVVVVGYGNKSIDFEDIYKSLTIMGRVLQKEKRAQEVVNYIKNLKNEFVDINKQQSAYIGAVAYKGLHGLNSTKADFMPFLLAKVENVVSPLQNSGQLFIDKEFFLLHNPNSIFIDNSGFQLLQEDFRKNKEFFSKLKAFEDSTYLILANTFYYVNIDQMLANSFFIVKILYPKYYKNLLPEKKADEIFEFFVGESMYKIIEKDTGGFKQIIIKNDDFVLKSVKYD